MRAFLFVLVAVFLSGCTTIEVAVDLAKKYTRTSTGEVLVANPHYKVGNPYEIKGLWYYPERDLNYDETGIASWYGEETVGLTANGEVFEPGIVSAAHKTLPMPSAVRVTNLENGRSLVVRVNDRGPFVSGRIIDLSREGARLLGFQKNGIARVRVQILAEESLRLEREAKAGNFPQIGTQANAPKPQTSAAAVPKVSLNSNAKKKKQQETVSAIDLLSSTRTTEVIELNPVDTTIFIQIGAFGELGNAEVVRNKVRNFGKVEISSFDDGGKLIHRVRMGPFTDILEADKALNQVLNSGYRGAKIVLD